MHSEQIIIDSVLALWKSTVDRATRFFDGLSEEDAAEPVAPGRNRVVYLLGHLTAVHDRMIPLLGLGERVHPEMDASFVSNPDRAVGAGGGIARNHDRPPERARREAQLRFLGPLLQARCYKARSESQTSEDRRAVRLMV